KKPQELYESNQKAPLMVLHDRNALETCRNYGFRIGRFLHVLVDDSPRTTDSSSSLFDDLLKNIRSETESLGDLRSMLPLNQSYFYNYLFLVTAKGQLLHKKMNLHHNFVPFSNPETQNTLLHEAVINHKPDDAKATQQAIKDAHDSAWDSIGEKNK